MRAKAKGKYFVVRTYSGVTAQKTLWQVMSREMSDKDEAEFEAEWYRDMESNKDHNFFVVQMTDIFLKGKL